MEAKEINQAWEKGVKPRIFAVAVDGLSIIVNEKNPLTKLTMAQVGAIYRGEIKNWQAVGGAGQADLPLRPAVELRAPIPSSRSTS